MTAAPPSKTPRFLKSISPSNIPPLPPNLRSDTLHQSPCPSTTDPRSYYLANPSLVPPPLISSSPFIPPALVHHLMRKKKNSAIGVKFIKKGGFRDLTGQGDEITNMEGALHTFVTPVVGCCEMIGDYKYDLRAGGHGIVLFGDGRNNEERGKNEKANWKDAKWLARSVVLSAAIHMDFEGPKIMLRVCMVFREEVIGENLGEWEILSREEKQDDKMREPYDVGLRNHMVYCLTRAERLPARRDVTDAMDVETTIQFLEDAISALDSIEEKMVGKFAELYNDQIVSLELLFNTAVHQSRNEFSALEAFCLQGYVYTYNPASIFAREIGGAAILNRMMVAAIKHLSEYNNFTNMRVFAIGDYADKAINGLAAKALRNLKHIHVTAKDNLFKGPEGRYDVSGFQGAEGAMLVVHNNSDGFGQNIETEHEGGSLDGAVGSNSSGAASLERGRKDLLDYIC